MYAEWLVSTIHSLPYCCPRSRLPTSPLEQPHAHEHPGHDLSDTTRNEPKHSLVTCYASSKSTPAMWGRWRFDWERCLRPNAPNCSSCKLGGGPPEKAKLEPRQFGSTSSLFKLSLCLRTSQLLPAREPALGNNWDYTSVKEKRR